MRDSLNPFVSSIIPDTRAIEFWITVTGVGWRQVLTLVSYPTYIWSCKPAPLAWSLNPF